MDTRLSIRASSAAAWMARLSWRVLSGSIGSSPGNSQPPGSILPCACATRHHAQLLQKRRRQQRVAILAPLAALLDAQHHALAVDVADLQRTDLAGAQSGAIGHGQRRAVLDVRRRGDQPRHLLGTEHDGQPSGRAHRLDLGHQLAVAEGDVEEELESAQRPVDRRRRGAVVDHIQREAAQILRRGRVGRSPQWERAGIGREGRWAPLVSSFTLSDTCATGERTRWTLPLGEGSLCYRNRQVRSAELILGAHARRGV